MAEDNIAMLNLKERPTSSPSSSKRPSSSGEEIRRSAAGSRKGARRKKTSNRKKASTCTQKTWISDAEFCLKIHYAVCLICSTTVLLAMVTSFVSPAWEIVYYDKDNVFKLAEQYDEYEVKYVDINNDQGYFEIRYSPMAEDTTATIEMNAPIGNMTQPGLMFVPICEESSLWELCDTLPDDERGALENSNGSLIKDRCQTFLYISRQELIEYDYLDLMVHLSRSAVACAITAFICCTVGCCLGLFSTIRNQIIFAMITGVCFFASGLYTMFTTVLVLLRKSEVELDMRNLPPVIYNARYIINGWSMYVGWLAFLLSEITGAAWIVLSKELKKTCANFMYTSKYDQICSM